MSDSGCFDCCDPTEGNVNALDSYTGQMAPELEHLRNVGFGLIYKTGAPVPLRTLAAESEISMEDAKSRLTEIEKVGRARFDGDRNLVGIAGLSLEPTPHAIQIDGRDFWTWCALDAVGIFTALEATGEVRSSSPGESRNVDIRFVEGTTESTSALFIAGGYDGTDVFESWCPNVNFFATSEEAHTWANQSGIHGDIVSIPEVAEAARSIWATVVNGSSPSKGAALG